LREGYQARIVLKGILKPILCTLATWEKALNFFELVDCVTVIAGLTYMLDDLSKSPLGLGCGWRLAS
jgi:hypothetical protein